MNPAALLLPMLLGLGGCDAPAPLPYTLSLTQEGLGSLRLGDRFSASWLQTKVPGYTVEKLSPVGSANRQSILVLMHGQIPKAYLFSDPKGKYLAEISVVSDDIATETGQRIGDRLRAQKGLDCDHGVCRFKNNPLLHYRIDPETAFIREITLQKL